MTGPAERGTGPRLGDPLTARELQVLGALAAGHRRAAIGRNLGISPMTVKSHMRRIFIKLGARDTAHAVAIGYRTGAMPLTAPVPAQRTRDSRP